MENETPGIEELRRLRKLRQSVNRKISRENRLADMTDEKYNSFMDERAAKEKARRANMTQEQREAYKEAARKRSRKSYMKKINAIEE
jgi:topoisomerase IA-like protein